MCFIKKKVPRSKKKHALYIHIWALNKKKMEGKKFGMKYTDAHGFIANQLSSIGSLQTYKYHTTIYNYMQEKENRSFSQRRRW